MRDINGIVIHGAWTKPDMDIGAEEIRTWHIGRGFTDIGYHYVIRRNGLVDGGRPLRFFGAHTKGFNEDTIGICLVGGRPADSLQHPAPVWDFNYTRVQMTELVDLICWIRGTHAPVRTENILGHRDFPGVSKLCPGFDVQEWLKGSGL